jgi:hypothetical protein
LISYFARLHPFNGILDPLLHTPEFVKDRSALLFTWILAITAQFDHSSGVLAKRLRLHGEKLSKHVHSSGFKSVEIVQGYYISLLSATPAKTMAEERLWLYTNHAFGVAVELGLDQRAPLRNPGSAGNSLAATRISSPLPTAFLDHQPAEGEFTSRDLTYATSQRLARNRERTWLRILLWERANSAACGRMTTFPETELTQNIENWWLHPLADSADRFTCALILLRRQLAALHVDLRAQAALPHHSNPHWVLKQINSTLQPWIQDWIPLLSNSSAPSSYETDIAQIYLYYVYIHGCLWTLCYALYYISKSTQNKEDVHAIREDCFEAAVKACEFAVRDLQTVGEPLYGMLSPTWAMISYAAVLALQLFPLLYGTRPGSEVELLSLLGQVALQLERAGSTPSHRFGIAAMLGQHLLMILRTRTASLRDSVVHPENNEEVMLVDQQQYENGLGMSDLQPYSHLLTGFDPFLIPMPTPSDMECNGEAFADIFRELFGQGFGGVF